MKGLFESMGTFERFAGLDVVPHALLEAVPHMTVSPAFAALMPAEFVADLNAWMLEFFGATEPSAYIVGGHTLYIAPSLLRQIRQRIAR